MGASTTLTLKLTQSLGTPCGACTEIHLGAGNEGFPGLTDRDTGEYFPPPVDAFPMALLLVVELAVSAPKTVHNLRVDLFGQWGVPALVAYGLPELSAGRTTIALLPTSPSAKVSGGLPRVITRVRVRWAFCGEGLIHDREREFLSSTGTGR